MWRTPKNVSLHPLPLYWSDASCPEKTLAQPLKLENETKGSEVGGSGREGSTRKTKGKRQMTDVKG